MRASEELNEELDVERKRVCILCKYFIFDVGQNDEVINIGCSKGKWMVDSRKTTEKEYRKYNLMASTCDDYNSNLKGE